MKSRVIICMLAFVFMASIALGQVDTSWMRIIQDASPGVDIACDRSGNVYSICYIYNPAIIKYLPNGDTAWIRKSDYGGNMIHIDRFDNIYVSGWGTARFDTAGNLIWHARWGGEYIETDNWGNIFVIDRQPDYEHANFVTVKYRPNGDTAWMRTYGGPAHSADRATAIKTDDQGNVYITGGSWGNETRTDCLTIKYDSLGNLLWASRFNSPANKDDKGVALELDSDNNLYVVGESGSDMIPDRLLTIKYNPSGDTAWTRIVEYCIGIKVLVDKRNNVYAIGNGNGGIRVIKYSPDGDSIWTRAYSGLQKDYGRAYDVSFDNDDNIIIAGQTYGHSNRYEITLVKYNQSGKQLWEYRLKAAADSYGDAINAIAVYPDNSIYATGYIYLDSRPKTFTAKYVEHSKNGTDNTGVR